MYGNHYARLPLPQYVFPGLARRWEELAPPELAGVVQQARIEEYIAADEIVIDDYNLRTHRVQFVQHPQRGFTGTCTYALRGPDEATSEESPDGAPTVVDAGTTGFLLRCWLQDTDGHGTDTPVEGGITTGLYEVSSSPAQEGCDHDG